MTKRRADDINRFFTMERDTYNDVTHILPCEGSHDTRARQYRSVSLVARDWTVIASVLSLETEARGRAKEIFLPATTTSNDDKQRRRFRANRRGSGPRADGKQSRKHQGRRDRFRGRFAR